MCSETNSSPVQIPNPNKKGKNKIHIDVVFVKVIKINKIEILLLAAMPGSKVK